MQTAATQSLQKSYFTLAVDIKEKIKRVISEFVQRDKLRKHNLENRRKILLSGPSGTGKTLTASIIANELRLPHYTILMDKMVTKYMGETSVVSSSLSDFFDEFGKTPKNRQKMHFKAFYIPIFGKKEECV